MARRRTKKGGRVGKRTTEGGRWLEGALKRRQGWKTHYLRWSMARRRTKKEAGLENALPKVVNGSKAHLKRGR